MAIIHSPDKSQGKNIKARDISTPSIDNQTFTFSFEYVQKDYCFENLEQKEKIAVINSFVNCGIMKKRSVIFRCRNEQN